MRVSAASPRISSRKRLPTIEEINAVAPDTPVFLPHLYDRALPRRLRAVGHRDTPDPLPARSRATAAGTTVCWSPSRMPDLYATLAKGPKPPFDYQLNSTCHFMRELNRLG